MACIEGRIPFSPQALYACTWVPGGGVDRVKGVIVALHGLESHAKQATRYLGPFARDRGWVVHAIDLPGFGHWEPAGKRGGRAHWALMHGAIDRAVDMGVQEHPGVPVVLLGSSMGGLLAIEHAIDHPDPRVKAVVGLVPAIGGMSLPWYLMLGAGLLIAFRPGTRVDLTRHDAGHATAVGDTGTAHGDPLATTRVEVGLLFKIFKATRRSGVAGRGHERWDPGLPLFLATAGKDAIVKAEDVKTFHDGLPPGTPRAHHHYEQSHHGLLFDVDRERLFDDMLAFLDRAIPRGKEREGKEKSS